MGGWGAHDPARRSGPPLARLRVRLVAARRRVCDYGSGAGRRARRAMAARRSVQALKAGRWRPPSVSSPLVGISARGESKRSCQQTPWTKGLLSATVVAAWSQAAWDAEETGARQKPASVTTPLLFSVAVAAGAGWGWAGVARPDTRSGLSSSE